MGALTAVFIGDRTLGVVEGKPSAKGVELTRSATVSLPEDFGGRDLDGRAAAIREALDAAGADARSCVLVIPRHVALLRTFMLPPGTPEEIDSMVRFQLEKELPLLPDQVRYSYTNVPEEGKVRVTAVAVPKEALDKIVAPLEKAGMRVTGAVVSSFGLMRLLPSEPLEGGTLLVNLADGAAEILIAEGGNVHLSRNTAVRDIDSEGLAAEIGRAMLSHSSREAGGGVKRILVAGEGDPAEQMATDLRRRIPATSVDALVVNGRVTRRPDVRLTVESAAAAGVLVGLLQPGMPLPDVLRPPVIRRALKITRAHKIGAAAGLAALVLVVTSQVALTGRRSEFESLKAALTKIKPASDRVDRMRSNSATLQKWQDKRFAWVDLFEQLRQRLPTQKIHLTSLRADENGNLALEGRARDNGTVLEFVTELQKLSPVFRQVEPSAIRPNQDRGEFTQTFTIKITLNDLAPPPKKTAKPALKK